MSFVEQQNNKRIAKNTLLLYFRMLLTMAVGLYTSRVVIQALGVDDFGIYNVVGGFVAMFAMLSGSLSAAISRFITFELGKNDLSSLKKVFSSAVTVQFFLALLILLIAETTGLWFLNNKMNIPIDRLSAANWALHLSIITFCIDLVSVPYNAAIVAHEKMSVFAYVSIFEALGKLSIAWAISISPIDKLIFYAILMCLFAVLVRLIYGAYCKKFFVECTYHFVFDGTLLKQMFAFAGWNFFGAGSYQLMTQGVNVLMNIFFGVAVNAARGVAMQIDAAIMQFVNNFTTAINPQITKSYASGNIEYLHKLLFSGAKYSYFLLMFFAIPTIYETHFTLDIWLKNVPDHACAFVRLALILSLIHVLSNTMITAMLATGNIRNYQIIVGGIGMLVFPLSFVAFKLGMRVETAYIINIAVFVMQFFCRLFFMRNMINMPIGGYLKLVLARIIPVTVLSCMLPSIAYCFFEESLLRFILIFSMSFGSSLLFITYLGLEKNERLFLYEKVKNIINRGSELWK